jgi:hypothetical protein
LATGGGLGTRKLYENDEEQLFDAQRPVMITGITELTDREDFLDRCIFIHCPPMDEDQRRDEAEFIKAWEKARPRILWGFLNAVSAGLLEYPDTKPERLPRMADFARWMMAIEPAIWDPGTFMAAYKTNRDEANEVAVDNPTSSAVKRMALADNLKDTVNGGDYGTANGHWQGSATQLLAILADHYSTERERGSDEWPKNARALAAKLNRMRPNLEDGGIMYKSAHRMITIGKA